MIPLYWLIAFAVLVGVEVATMALTTVWFAGGAMVAFFLALMKFDVDIQLLAFVVSSFILLVVTRPLVAGHFGRRKITKTNADRLVGRTARVTADINNNLGTGTAVVEGQEWTARTLDEDQVIEAGTKVVIREIQGVKLIVTPCDGSRQAKN
ncbi:MAG: NfeD family protein [Lachnospiraceae bacterium]|nr:NfeD family protein [Lachnospiraceae bacterium]